jgi:hypothetical protein
MMQGRQRLMSQADNIAHRAQDAYVKAQDAYSMAADAQSLSAETFLKNQGLMYLILAAIILAVIFFM